MWYLDAVEWVVFSPFNYLSILKKQIKKAGNFYY